MKLYLDTSVYGGFYDEGMEASIDLIDAINERGIQVFYSNVVAYEFSKASKLIKEKLDKVLKSIKNKQAVTVTSKVNSLADTYIRYEIVSPKSMEDAQHKKFLKEILKWKRIKK